MKRGFVLLAAVLLVASVPGVGAGHADDGTGACDPQDDGGSGGDAPRDQDGAVPLGSGTVSGCLDVTDHEDVYRTELEPGEHLRVEIGEDTCQRAEDRHTNLVVSLRGVRDAREAGCDRDVSASLVFTAEGPTEAFVEVEGEVYEGALNYTLVVEREVVPLPDPHVVEIEDRVRLEVGTPAGDVPLPNAATDAEPFELRRERRVSVTIGNAGNGTAHRSVDVRLHAVPDDCALPDQTPGPAPPFYRTIHHSRCASERILSGEVTDLAVNQTVEFSTQWDTTHTVGEQRLVATLDLNGGPDLDRSNNHLEETTPVVIGTDKGMN